MIAPYSNRGAHGNILGIWKYPGGSSIKVVTKFGDYDRKTFSFTGATISIAPVDPAIPTNGARQERMLADSRWREAAAPEALGSLARASQSRDLSVSDRTSLAVDPLRSSGSAENEEFWSWLVRPERWRCGCVARGLRRIAVADRRAGRDAASLGGNDAGDPVRALNPNENNNMNTEVALGFFDSGIEALLERCPWFVRRCYCLITCLDSGRNTADALACCLPRSDVVIGHRVNHRGDGD